MKNIHLFLVALIGITGLGIGCDDNTKPPGNDTVIVGSRDMNVPLGGSEPMMDMSVATEARELRVVGMMNRTVYTGQQVDIQVRLLALRGGSEVALANQAVSMKLFDNAGNDRTATGVQGTSLQASRVNTNTQGLATFRVFAGDPNVTVRLQASAADAAPVTINLAISQPPSGDLKVKVLYDAQAGRYSFLDLNEARVSLFVDRTCDTIIADPTRLTGATFAWPPITPFDDINNSVSDTGFEHDAQFTVAASVYSASGRAVGFGCLEDVTITGGQETEVMVNATDLPLEFKGKFVTTNRFDLGDLLRSSEDETLANVADALDILRLLGSNEPNRGGELIRLFCDIADIDMGACAIVSGIGGPALEAIIDAQVPQDVLNVLAVISDVLTIVSEMTIVGEIEFPESYPDENNMLTGDNRWQRFRFQWRDGCMAQNCDREFTIGNLDNDNRPIAGLFDAEVIDAQTLDIYDHGLNFRFGLIALGIAEQWVLPSVVGRQGPVSLRDLLSDLMATTCVDIDNYISNPGFCQNVIVNALSAVIIDQLSNLNFSPEQFRINGSATLVDNDTDLRIDQLKDGVWYGSIDTGNVMLRFNGCFTGCRDAECVAPENECDIPMYIPEMNEMMGMNGN